MNPPSHAQSYRGLCTAFQRPIPSIAKPHTLCTRLRSGHHPWQAHTPTPGRGTRCTATPSPAGDSEAVKDILAESNVLDLPRQEDFERAQQREARKLGIRRGTFSVGDVVNGRYTILQELGSGSSSTTYKASTPDGNVVALKTMSFRSIKDWKQLELFERESKILKSLSHPGIPAYIDSFEVDTDDDRAYVLVQELAQGLTLEQLIEQGWRVDETEVERIAGALLDTLEYLGSRRPPVVHRDVKPANIVLQGGASGGRVYLVDFGGVQAAALQAADGAMGSTIIGTYGYMAPEQFRGQAQASSDLYGLGGVLLYLLSGSPPSAFPSTNLRIDFEDSVPMSGRLRRVVAGLLEPIAEDRLTANQARRILSGETNVRGSDRSSTRGSPSRQSTPAAQMGGRVTMPRGGMDRRRGGGMEVMVPQPVDMLGMPMQMQMEVPMGVRKPAGARSSVAKRGLKLEVVIPPAPMSGSTLGTGAFAIAWNAFVLTWTVGALAGGGVLFALFSLPFWVAGVGLAKSALAGALLKEKVDIGINKWSIKQELAVLDGGAPKWSGLGEQESEGDTQDLSQCRVHIAGYVNGVPQTVLQLKEGVNTYTFGEGLPLLEQQWIASEINRHLQELDED